MFKIRYFCHWGRLTGFGRAARDYVAALERLDDVELEIAVLGDAGCTSPEPRYSHLDELCVPYDQVQGDADVEVYHALPRVLAALIETVPQRAGKRVALTTWETEPMPDILAQPLAGFDGVIVPSEFCADAIAATELVAYNRIHLIPHCFDEDFWAMPSAQDRADIAEARDAAYRFYSIGAWGERKNTLGIVRAYLHAFRKSDNAQLMLLCDGANFDEVRSLIARSGLSPAELPELYMPDHKLEEMQLLELHAAADCFVSATRGEGFGLGHFEAAIMGRYVISPMCGGHYDFLDDYAWAHSVPYQMTPCFGGETRARVEEHDGQKWQASVVDLPAGVDCRQKWADPDLDQLASEMRSLYENRHNTVRAESDIRRERSVLEARFGYKTVGPQLAQKLREIAYT